MDVSMSRSDYGMRILIVGGGIAGLALAKALEQRGITAELCRRASERGCRGCDHGRRSGR